MELSQLRIFQEVAHHGSMKKAADALFLSQSTISKSISALEADLGYLLFEREKNRILLTPAGRAFLPHVKQAMIELESARVKGQEAVDEASQIINVGSSMPWFMYKALSGFRANHPQITINCTNGSTPALCGSLMKKVICFAITYESINDANIHSLPVMSEDCYILSGKQLTDNDHGNVTLSALSAENFALSSPNSTWSNIEDSFFASAGFSPKVSFRGISPQNSTTNLLLETESLCIVPAHTAFNIRWTDQQHKLFYYRLSDSYTYLTIWLSTYTNYIKNRYEREFRDTMLASLEEIEAQLNDYALSNYELMERLSDHNHP